MSAVGPNRLIPFKRRDAMSQDIVAIPGAGCCPMPTDLEAQSDIYLMSSSQTLTPELRNQTHRRET